MRVRPELNMKKYTQKKVIFKTLIEFSSKLDLNNWPLTNFLEKRQEKRQESALNELTYYNWEFLLLPSALHSHTQKLQKWKLLNEKKSQTNPVDFKNGACLSESVAKFNGWFIFKNLKLKDFNFDSKILK